jgi:REP element-mobilizing transposase RayT
MRQPRIKIAAESGEGIYHCMSRTVNGARLFGTVEKEVFRKQLWQLADFCGVQVLTYAVMDNHFHVLARVPLSVPVDDAELLRRYRVLYPRPTRYQTAQLSVIRGQLTANGPEAIAWRRRMLALMGDISSFMKLLKQRFTRWFNRSHSRYGTLWSERFKSVLIEAVGHARKTVAAYIDLNSVRAGLAADPADYRFCGYAEAISGNLRAQLGMLQVMGCRSWSEAQAAYRQWLFGSGADPREHRGRITPEQLRQVMQAQGRLPLAMLLRCRVRYFSDGAVLGSQAFVAEQLAAYRLRTGRLRTTPVSLPKNLGCADLAVLHPIRRPAIEL